MKTIKSYEEIESELQAFEASERQRLGLEPQSKAHWRDDNPQLFTQAQRPSTTILLGGLTILQDALIQAALEAIDYRIELLPCPDNQALHYGKEFGNRGQCNPTYFTVGNLLKRLLHLRDVEGMPVPEIEKHYVFLTAGACGPCRFGTYATEYRKALRDAGFANFRVLLFQQQGGVKQATGHGSGLEMNLRFFTQILKAIMVGDILNVLGYRLRPYEIVRGEIDRVLNASRIILVEAFHQRKSILGALLRCRREFLKVSVDYLRPKPKVMIIGEFWAMTTEGDGNYRLQRFLESEGAEVDIQVVTAWLLYMIWQNQRDTRRRLYLRKDDAVGKGLAGRSGYKLLRKLWVAERMVRVLFQSYAKCAGLKDYHLPDMEQIAQLAQPFYDVELRGGEGHMEAGKLIDSVQNKRAHMVVSVKPFGCMPSSGVSDGIQSAVLSKFPEAIFSPIETTGDAEVNAQSRILMHLFKARRKAKEEFEAALNRPGIDKEGIIQNTAVQQRRSIDYPPHVVAGTAANVILAL